MRQKTGKRTAKDKLGLACADLSYPILPGSSQTRTQASSASHPTTLFLPPRRPSRFFLPPYHPSHLFLFSSQLIPAPLPLDQAGAHVWATRCFCGIPLRLCFHLGPELAGRSSSCPSLPSHLPSKILSFKAGLRVPEAKMSGGHCTRHIRLRHNVDVTSS
ncbi:hypothetical protein Pmani_021227 [Petrolisthes manimaculis]|uniref:Uncharacterized protein n=1 Tax=Petrolisthes manimaculis TaxID=1843537 RepID=A0AAE1PGP9_9EUCA|nr:hypothetical protein Pmani_021227 [Petrolisthes manimaculis]